MRMTDRCIHLVRNMLPIKWLTAFGIGMLVLVLAMVVRAKARPGLPLVSQHAGEAMQTSSGTSSLDWKELLQPSTQGMAVLALKRDEPVTTTGGSIDPYWTRVLPVRIEGVNPLELATTADVQAYWTASRLYMAISIREARMPSLKGLRLVLSGQDPAKRICIVWRKGDAASALQLGVDVRRSLVGASWSASGCSESGVLRVELAVSVAELSPAVVDGTSYFHVGICTLEGMSIEPDEDDPSIYWLLDSLRGARFECLLLDGGRWPTARFDNACVSARGAAISWDLPAYSLAPGEARDVRVAALVAWPTREPLRLRASLVPQPPTRCEALVWQSEVALPTEGAEPDWQTIRLAVPANAMPGVYTWRLILAEPALLAADTSLLVADAVQMHARSELIRKRRQIETMKGASATALSTVMAHINCCMNDVEQQPYVSRRLLRKMAELEMAIRRTESGEYPALPSGTCELPLTLSGGKRLTCLVIVPEHYDPQLAWPLVVNSEGHHDLPQMLQIRLAAGPDVVLPALASLEKLVHVDADRVYLSAFCGKVFSTSDCLFYRPERWAASMFFLRMQWSPLWLNARHVPIRCYCSTIDPVDQLACRTAERRLNQLGCPVEVVEVPDLPHQHLPHRYGRQFGRWLLLHRRTSRPAEVSFVTDRLAYRRSYWVSIEGIDDTNRLAQIEAKVSSSTVLVATRNVTGYRLDLADAPIDEAAPQITIIENGQVVGRVARDTHSAVFVRSLSAGVTVAGQPVDPWDAVLAEVKTEHPLWQWQYLASQAACDWAGADACAYLDSADASRKDCVGAITARRIASFVGNEWLLSMTVTRSDLDHAMQDARQKGVALAIAYSRQARNDMMAGRAGTNGPPAGLLLHVLVPNSLRDHFLRARECLLTDLFLAESFAHVLRGNSQLDLDAILSAVPARQRFAAEFAIDDVLQGTGAP